MPTPEIQICHRVLFIIEDSEGRVITRLPQEYELVETPDLNVGATMALIKDGVGHQVIVIKSDEPIAVGKDHFESLVRVRLFTTETV